MNMQKQTEHNHSKLFSSNQREVKKWQTELGKNNSEENRP